LASNKTFIYYWIWLGIALSGKIRNNYYKASETKYLLIGLR